MNNFIHHISGSDEYKDKQTNITKLTLFNLLKPTKIHYCVKLHQNLTSSFHVLDNFLIQKRQKIRQK